ncbi:fungal specific transcription factor domain-containing [Trichoderma arundinaceum]|uniref:Fungal specific transcription factor domain-containing n=1 Tax=Trichoderma arundinaceum TaxID=490622 RepID=A0A395NN99_TRIAR|nr:fungal specific transcription factor domain-containing [Trichoderma arundinaceum]
MAPELAGQKRSAECAEDILRDLPDSALRKTRKVSRACDFCEVRHSLAEITVPEAVSFMPSSGVISHGNVPLNQPIQRPGGPAAPSRASPELGMAEIQGQVFDPTSGLAFLHRASRRLSAHGGSQGIDDSRSLAENQLVYMAGDKPLAIESEGSEQQHTLPDPVEARALLTLYFDVCIATYRILHRPSTESWLSIMESNLQEGVAVWHAIGHAKAAIIYVMLAIAKFHQEKSKGYPARDCQALRLGDVLFRFSMRLADQETGFPKLESAQVRIVQVLYLLTTSRFNQSWYIFGNALQLISALGLQRRADWRRRQKSATDYIEKQCSLRSFWTAYVLDNYLGVVFGRPRHFHDDNIDQELPDRINDEDMSAGGPISDPDDRRGCHTDALVFHARLGILLIRLRNRIAKIIGAISQEMYTAKHNSEVERIAAAKDLTQRVRDWHQSLPAHLGAVHPSILIPSYRRPALALGLAHSHAIMHANRLFLMRSPASVYVTQVSDCIKAAKDVLESVDSMARGSPIFHAFWWTHYVTFCALVVTYVWAIQQHRMSVTDDPSYRTRLMQLAENCHGHLARATASNSPSRRYAVILEGFRAAAVNNSIPQHTRPHYITPNEQPGDQNPGTPVHSTEDGIGFGSMSQSNSTTEMPTFLDWQLTDWLDLDSSAFWPSFNLDEVVLSPDGNDTGEQNYNT